MVTCYHEALQQVFHIYWQGGFWIVTIHSDNKFKPLIEPLSQEFGVAMNYANPQEHVPEAECNNQVIKEQVRAAYHRLPYSRLPWLMIQTIVTNSAKKLNFSPHSTALPYYSLRVILHQRHLDYNKQALSDWFWYFCPGFEQAQSFKHQSFTFPRLHLSLVQQQQSSRRSWSATPPN